MYQNLSLSIIIITFFIGMNLALSEELGCTFEDGAILMQDQFSLSELNDSDIITFAVAGKTIHQPTSRTYGSIKEEIDIKVEVGNPFVINKAAAEKIKCPGDDGTTEKADGIYKYLQSKWSYTGDPRSIDYWRYANETIHLGETAGLSGAGDCDDFAILMSAYMENIGASTRIILAYSKDAGHAFCEVYLGKLNANDNKVNRSIEWLEKNHRVDKIYAHIDKYEKDVWLNLDWGPDKSKSFHPGGPFFSDGEDIKYVPIFVGNVINKTPLIPPNEKPVALFSYWPSEPAANQDNVCFNASQSTDPYGSISDYYWEFGDGSNSSGKVAYHTYKEGNKSFLVNLTVTDDEGEEGLVNSTAIRVNMPPIPVISYMPKEPKLGDFVEFDSKGSYDPDGSIKKYRWEFGDGETSTKEHPSPYKYDTNRSYNVSLTVEDDKGAIGTAFKHIKVNLPPKAIMQIEPPQLPNNGDEVRFDASGSIDLDGSIKKWHWDFGDGNNSSAERASNIYSKGGEFTVRLNVTDDNNASNEYSRNIKVNWLPVPIISIDAINGLEVKFNGSKSFDPEGGPLKHEWDFENDDDIDKKIIAWTNRYPTPGKYTAKLKVIDENGASNTTTITINIENIEKPPPNMTSIKINRPNNTELVPVRTIVSGKSRKLEPSEHLWIMVNPYAQTDLWWPQEETKPGNDESWYSEATIGGSPGDIDQRFDIAAIVVDRSENKRIHEWTNQGKSGMLWNESWKKQDVVTVKLRAPNVKILSPANGTVPETFEVNGTSEDPVPGHLWLVVRPHNTPDLWYPQGPNPIKVIAGKWHQIAWINDTDMYSDIAVVLVNEETNKNFTKWHEQGQKTQKWTGLFLPTDIWIGPIIEVIRNQPPILSSLSPDKKSPQEEGSVITWEANASDPEGDRLLYQFLINGKAMTDWMSDNTWSWNAGKDYLGTSQVEVRIRDGIHADADNFDDRAVRDFEISIKEYPTVPANNPPIAKISYDIAEPTVEDTIIFDASDSYDINGSISRYDWHFEDEVDVLHGPHQPHKFRECGGTKVGLTVFDNENASNSTSIELMIRNNPREKFTLNHDHRVISVVFISYWSVVTASDDNTVRIWDASSGQKRKFFSAPVLSAEFSPDGTKVITASEDNTSRIWDASSGRELAKLPHEGYVRSAQFCSDGTKVVTASDDNTSRIWNASSGRELAKLPYESWVWYAQFSPDGTKVVTASEDKTARIWDAASGRELAKLPHEDFVVSAQFSPDGTKVVTASEDKTARIWDAASGQELAKLPHEGSVDSAQFSPNGTKVVTASEDKTARIWDAASGQELAKLPHEDFVASAQFSPDGTKVVTAGSDWMARIWNASSGRELAKLPHEGLVDSAQFSPDGSKVVTASRDNTARIWDAASGRELAKLPHEDWIKSVAFSPDGSKVVTASWDSTARIWDAASGRELAKLSHEDWIKSVAFSPDGAKLAIVSNDGTVHIWDISYHRLANIQHEAAVNSVVFSQDSARVATACKGTLRIWNASSGKELVKLPDKARVHGAIFSPDGTRMASSCYDNSSLCIWSSGSGREIRRIQAPVNSIVFSLDGTKLAAIINDSAVRIWDASSGKELIRIQHDETGGLVGIRANVNSIAFSPDGKKLATASSDNTARVWEVSTGIELVKMQHDAAVNFVVFSPDGTEIATTSSDNTARIWDASSGKELARIQHEAAVNSVAFSPDGTMLATASDDNTSRIWDTGICPPRVETGD